MQLADEAPQLSDELREGCSHRPPQPQQFSAAGRTGGRRLDPCLGCARNLGIVRQGRRGCLRRSRSTRFRDGVVSLASLLAPRPRRVLRLLAFGLACRVGLSREKRVEEGLGGSAAHGEQQRLHVVPHAPVGVRQPREQLRHDCGPRKRRRSGQLLAKLAEELLAELLRTMPDEQAQEAQRHHYGRIHRPVSSRQGEVVERCRSSYANGRSRGARAGGEGSLVAPVGPAELHGGVAWAARHCGAETCLSELLERSGGRAVPLVGRLVGTGSGPALFPGGPRPSRDLRCRAGR